jgi:hypothetical protein
MAKPNYSYEKRQRELARKKKQEEKRLRHARPKPAGDATLAPDGAEAPAEERPGEPPKGDAGPDTAESR